MTNMTESIIPEEAYLFFPKNHVKPKVKRLIFDGNSEFEASEVKAISQFRAFIEKHNYTLTPLWTDNMILRFLYANNFKMEGTLSSIKLHTNWADTTIPVPLTDKILEFLNSGLIYLNGRDHKYRPIVIFNVYKLDPSTVDFKVVLDVLTFWFEYIINECMLPGQVENWIFLANIKGMGMSSIAVQGVRNLFKYLQDHYKCRLFKVYILNASPAIYVPWQIVKTFLDGDTVDKVHFYTSQKPKSLFKHTNPTQVEEQYGGTAPNLTEFWPPKVFSDNYFVDESDSELLITKEQYALAYQRGELQNMTVNQNFIEGMRRSQENINPNNPTISQPLLTSSIANLSESQKSSSLLELKKLGDPRQGDSEDLDENTDYEEEVMRESILFDLEVLEVKEFQASFLSEVRAIQKIY